MVPILRDSGSEGRRDTWMMDAHSKLARYKEIFPAAAKTDAIDARKILELFRLKEYLPVAKDVVQEVAPVPVVNGQLKRLSRRRQLVDDKIRVICRLQADLQAVAPSLVAITKNADNLWFLRFLTCRNDLAQLARLRKSSILAIPGVGKKYAADIEAWQKKAHFSADVAWESEMIIQDARRVLELLEEIKKLEEKISEVSKGSELAQRLGTIPGFGKTTTKP